MEGTPGIMTEIAGRRRDLDFVLMNGTISCLYACCMKSLKQKVVVLFLSLRTGKVNLCYDYIIYVLAPSCLFISAVGNVICLGIWQKTAWC